MQGRRPAPPAPAPAPHNVCVTLTHLGRDGQGGLAGPSEVAVRVARKQGVVLPSLEQRVGVPPQGGLARGGGGGPARPHLHASGQTLVMGRQF